MKKKIIYKTKQLPTLHMQNNKPISQDAISMPHLDRNDNSYWQNNALFDTLNLTA